MKTIKQRQRYIKRKGKQLDEIKDFRKYNHRLARVMLYHRLLTDLEMAYIKNNLKGEFD